MDNATVGLVCTITGTGLGIIGTVVGVKKASKDNEKDIKKQTKEETGSLTKVETKLDYISKGVDDIRLDIKAQDRKISEITERVVRVEESTKSAHKRLDGIEREE